MEFLSFRNALNSWQPIAHLGPTSRPFLSEWKWVTQKHVTNKLFTTLPWPDLPDDARCLSHAFPTHWYLWGTSLYEIWRGLAQAQANWWIFRWNQIYIGEEHGPSNSSTGVAFQLSKLMAQHLWSTCSCNYHRPDLVFWRGWQFLLFLAIIVMICLQLKCLLLCI